MWGILVNFAVEPAYTVLVAVLSGQDGGSAGGADGVGAGEVTDTTAFNAQAVVGGGLGGALWVGALFGITDALLGRHGHSRLFGRDE